MIANLLLEAKLTDVFQVDEEKKKILKILKPDEVKLFKDRLKQNDDGQWYYENDETEVKYEIDNSAQEKLSQLLKKSKSNGRDENPYSNVDVWRKIGESLCYLVMNKVTNGKMKDGDAKVADYASNLANEVEPEEFVTRFRMAFKGNKEVDDSFFKDHNIFEVMNIFAARAAYLDAKHDDSLNADQLDKYATEKDGKIEYDEDFIASNTATKTETKKYLNEFEDAMDNGVKDGKEAVEKTKDKGGKIKDPLTGEVVEIDGPSFFKKLGSKALAGAAGVVGDVLGITDGKDIFSMAFRGILGMIRDEGGIRKMLARGKKAAWKQNKKLKNKTVKQNVLKLIKIIKDKSREKPRGIPE